MIGKRGVGFAPSFGAMNPIKGRNMNTAFYFASLEGELVECNSNTDAEAVNRADALLREVAHGTAGELHALAVVLVRYGRQRPAERLTNRASQLRAAQFLTPGERNAPIHARSRL
jgi:hypothetical protein